MRGHAEIVGGSERESVLALVQCHIEQKVARLHRERAAIERERGKMRRIDAEHPRGKLRARSIPSVVQPTKIDDG